MRRKDVPKKILVGNNVYDVRFQRIVDANPFQYGLCDGDDKEIVIRTNLSSEERGMTLIHEILHAFEFEYSLTIPHKLIYKLERPIYDLFTKNLIEFIK